MGRTNDFMCKNYFLENYRIPNIPPSWGEIKTAILRQTTNTVIWHCMHQQEAGIIPPSWSDKCFYIVLIVCSCLTWYFSLSTHARAAQKISNQQRLCPPISHCHSCQDQSSELDCDGARLSSVQIKGCEEAKDNQPFFTLSLWHCADQIAPRIISALCPRSKRPSCSSPWTYTDHIALRIMSAMPKGDECSSQPTETSLFYPDNSVIWPPHEPRVAPALTRATPTRVVLRIGRRSSF